MAEARCSCGKSFAIEFRKGRAYVVEEYLMPFVRYSGNVFYINERPSVIVNGKKYFVEEII